MVSEDQPFDISLPDEVELRPLPGIPAPPWLIAAIAVTVLAFMLGLSRIARAIDLGVAYERASRQLQAGNPTAAVKGLEYVSREYPESLDLRISLAEAYLGAGMLEPCARVLNSMEGTYVSQERFERIDAIGKRLDAEFKKLDATGGGERS